MEYAFKTIRLKRRFFMHVLNGYIVLNEFFHALKTIGDKEFHPKVEIWLNFEIF